MPTRAPSTDRPRPAPRSRLLSHVVGVVSVGALVLAPVAALTLWLLLTDSVTSAAVVEQGDLAPVLKALATLVGRAMAAALRYL